MKGLYIVAILIIIIFTCCLGMYLDNQKAKHSYRDVYTDKPDTTLHCDGYLRAYQIEIESRDTIAIYDNQKLKGKLSLNDKSALSSLILKDNDQ